ncbi:MAG: MFS transporter [Sphingobium sp.]
MATGNSGGDGLSFRLLMLVLVVAELTCALETNMMFVAMATLYKLYGNPFQVGWLITGFSLTAAASAAICGRLGDIYGRTRVLTVVLAIAAAGSIASASTDHLGVIIAGRAIQGVSMAILPLAYGILQERAPSDRVLFGVGILGATYTVGGGFAGLLGGLLVDAGHWQAIFWVGAGLALITLIGVVAFLPSSPRSAATGRLDIVGGILFAPAIAAILLSFALSQSIGWGTTSIGLLLAGLATGACWIFYELRHANPLINVRLLSHRKIALTNVAVFFTALGPMLSPLILLPLLQQPVWTGIGLGISAALAASIKIPGNVVGGLASVYAGNKARQWGVRRVVMVGAMMTIAGWLVILFKHDSVLWIALAFALVMAPGMTIIAACTPSLIMEATPNDRTSEATGLTQVVRSLGYTIGSQLVAFILGSSIVSSAAHPGEYPSETAYLMAFALAIGCGMIALLAVIAIGSGARDRASTSEPASTGKA